MSLHDLFMLKEELTKVRHLLETVMLFKVRVFTLLCSRQWVEI